MTDRRTFLRSSAAAAALGALGGASLASAEQGEPQRERPRAKDPLRILVLGGTGFLGPHCVRAALARGHELTLFNRGRTNPQLFPDVEKLRGDRDGDLEALKGREWDCVIDTSAYFPRVVRDSVGLLKDAVEQYLLVSTISVYRDFPAEDVDEGSAVGRLEDPTTEDFRAPQNYGPLKALCEEAAEELMPGHVTNVRPGLIVGPGDWTDRYTYWPVRVAEGGEVLAPGRPEHTVQYIDVRDLADWMLHTLEAGVVGVYNAVGPERPLPMGELLTACKEVSGSDARFTWVAADFLEQEGVRPWADMPMWIPPGEDRERCTVANNERAVEAGLRFRPVRDTALATLEWHGEERPADHRLRAGLAREREAEVLAKWHAREEGR